MATAKQYREKSKIRTQQSRAAVIAAGGSHLGTVIGPEATDALLSLTDTGATKREAVEAALIAASKEKRS